MCYIHLFAKGRKNVMAHIFFYMINSPFAVLGRQCLDCIIHIPPISITRTLSFYVNFNRPMAIKGSQVLLARTPYTRKYILPILTNFFWLTSSYDMKSENHWLRQVPKCILSVFVTYSLFYIIHRVKICYKQPVLIHQI